MKKTFILTLVLAMGLASCGDDKKEDSEKETNEQKVAKIACGCSEKAVAAMTDTNDPSMEDMEAAQGVYIECVSGHMEEMKKLQINNDKMMGEMKKTCPDAANMMEKMRSAM